MPNRGVKICKIKIEEFRRFQDVEFDIGNCITLISGQNGTSKSTLLGMLCQPFSFGVVQGRAAKSADNSKYTNNYHGLRLAEYKDLTGNAFNYTCHDVFRLSKVHDNDPDKYKYRLYLTGDCINTESQIYSSGLFVRAQRRGDEKPIRFVAGPKISSEAGEGNFPHPVIYFGLNRHWPLALVKKMVIGSDPKVDNECQNWYIENYNKILLLDEDTNQAEYITASERTKHDFIGVSSIDYNSESISAGQDNLGQILTAILSFRHLKSKLGDKYQGGLILIDELDSTLHANAQMQLLEMLCDAAEEYQLQIVATTHSMYMLQKAFRSQLKNKIKVIYLNREDNHVTDSGFSSFEEIEHNLEVKATKSERAPSDKVSLMLEDAVSRDMFLGIIGNVLDNYIKIFDDATFSEGYLRNLVPLALQVPEFAKVVMILDGDVKKSSKIPKNLLFLPGDERPETVIYKWLKKLSDADFFWKEITGTGYGYTKQFAIGRYNSIKNKDKKFYKNWYKEQHPYWGGAINIVFEKWADRNKDLCKRFCNDFLKIFDQVSPRTLPIELMNQIIEKYSSNPIIIEADTKRSHLSEQRKIKKKKVPNENLQVNMFTQYENS